MSYNCGAMSDAMTEREVTIAPHVQLMADVRGYDIDDIRGIARKPAVTQPGYSVSAIQAEVVYVSGWDSKNVRWTMECYDLLNGVRYVVTVAEGLWEL